MARVLQKPQAKRVAHPRFKRDVWLHVDHFEKPDTLRVWAVQYWCKRRQKWIYRTAVRVFFPAGETLFRGRFEQPKGVTLFRNVRVVSSGPHVWLRRTDG